MGQWKMTNDTHLKTRIQLFTFVDRGFSLTVTNGNNYSHYSCSSVAKQYEDIESGGSEQWQLQ
jgi:hypothetical protein